MAAPSRVKMSIPRSSRLAAYLSSDAAAAYFEKKDPPGRPCRSEFVPPALSSPPGQLAVCCKAMDNHGATYHALGIAHKRCT